MSNRATIEDIVTAIKMIANHKPGYSQSIIGEIHSGDEWGVGVWGAYYRVWYDSPGDGIPTGKYSKYFVDLQAQLIYKSVAWSERGDLVCTVDNLLDEVANL